MCLQVSELPSSHSSFLSPSLRLPGVLPDHSGGLCKGSSMREELPSTSSMCCSQSLCTSFWERQRKPCRTHEPCCTGSYCPKGWSLVRHRRCPQGSWLPTTPGLNTKWSEHMPLLTFWGKSKCTRRQKAKWPRHQEPRE